MVLHRVRLSQRTELNTVTVLPEDHNMDHLITVTNIHVFTQMAHHKQTYISENTNTVQRSVTTQLTQQEVSSARTIIVISH